MRFSTTFTAVIIATSVPATLAAPAPSLFGDILGGVLAKVNSQVKTSTKSVSELSQLVSKLGTTLQTNAKKHGSVWSCLNISVPKIIVSKKRFSHKISWPFTSKVKFVDWKTYKSNGINLGAWLEQ